MKHPESAHHFQRYSEAPFEAPFLVILWYIKECPLPPSAENQATFPYITTNYHRSDWTSFAVDSTSSRWRCFIHEALVFCDSNDFAGEKEFLPDFRSLFDMYISSWHLRPSPTVPIYRYPAGPHSSCQGLFNTLVFSSNLILDQTSYTNIHQQVPSTDFIIMSVSGPVNAPTTLGGGSGGGDGGNKRRPLNNLRQKPNTLSADAALDLLL